MIYLDHHAATPVLPEVTAAIEAARAAGAWANASSVHAAGRRARRWLEGARDEVAAELGVSPAEVVFTGGGTEACNLGVRGLLLAGHRVVTTPLEHPAVRLACERADEAHELDVSAGLPEAEAVGALLGPDDLLAVQWVNHETGVVLPALAWAGAARAAGAKVFVDATQALGKVDVRGALEVCDAVAFAGQKVGAPAGVGALLVRRGVDLAPVRDGGGQERGRRPGTPDVSHCVGFAAATRAAGDHLTRMPAIAALRDRWEAAAEALGGVVSGKEFPRVATASSVAFQGQRSELLVAALDLEGVCVSAGAACSSGVSEPVASVLALYPNEPWRATSSIRASLGHGTTRSEIDAAIAALRRVLAGR